MAPVPIRMGGYGPPTTGFSQGAANSSATSCRREFGDRVAIKYVWNIMDLGYKAEDILWLVENGVLTLGYQSSSYLTDRVPELGFVDLPFLFADNAQARARHGRRARRSCSRARSRSASTTASSAGSRTASATSPTGCARCMCRPTSRACASACCRARSSARTFELLGAVRDAHGPDRSHRHDQGRHARRAGKSARQHRHLWRAQIPQIPHAHLLTSTFRGRSSCIAPRSTPGRTICKRAMQQGGDRGGRVPARARGRGERGVAQDHRGRRLRDRRTDGAGARRLRRRRAAASRRRAQDVWRARCSRMVPKT